MVILTHPRALSIEELHNALELAEDINFKRERDTIHCRVGNDYIEIADISDFVWAIYNAHSTDGIHKFVVYRGEERITDRKRGGEQNGEGDEEGEEVADVGGESGENVGAIGSEEEDAKNLP